MDGYLAAVDVLDQAFADFSRVDVGDSPVEAASTPRSMTKELATDIARQLNVLDRQREQLAALLSSVDASSLKA